MDSKVAAWMGRLRADWLAPVLPTVMVVVHTELALFTVQIGKSSAASSAANTHGQKETKPLEAMLLNNSEQCACGARAPWRRGSVVVTCAPSVVLYSFLAADYVDRWWLAVCDPQRVRVLQPAHRSLGAHRPYGVPAQPQWRHQPGQVTLCSRRCLLSKNLKVRMYKTVLLPAVLHGCETWTLALREEQKLRAFENKVLRKIFGAKRDEVTGEWGKLHNAELHAL
ncbi:hypothetical protein ANN_26826 [Periplaneta americana]|uniref:Uncharacterized protein n=1 Tax=Periplaneta americana TaxID=6978 RepID=A0ABQ8RZD6_PERAM|nr:hypothetical protein ANN_26826 [Periplaneta americana]